jgi:hypothetical protein
VWPKALSRSSWSGPTPGPDRAVGPRWACRGHTRDIRALGHASERPRVAACVARLSGASRLDPPRNAIANRDRAAPDLWEDHRPNPTALLNAARRDRDRPPNRHGPALPVQHGRDAPGSGGAPGRKRAVGPRWACRGHTRDIRALGHASERPRVAACAARRRGIICRSSISTDHQGGEGRRPRSHQRVVHIHELVVVGEVVLEQIVEPGNVLRPLQRLMEPTATTSSPPRSSRPSPPPLSMLFVSPDHAIYGRYSEPSRSCPCPSTRSGRARAPDNRPGETATSSQSARQHLARPPPPLSPRHLQCRPRDRS